jgi:hypothetical protein
MMAQNDVEKMLELLGLEERNVVVSEPVRHRSRMGWTESVLAPGMNDWWIREASANP